MSALEQQWDIFNKFCKECYGGFDYMSQSCVRSKTITRAKGEMMVRLIKGDPVTLTYCPKFKHWVKQRGFKLITYAALGLNMFFVYLQERRFVGYVMIDLSYYALFLLLYRTTMIQLCSQSGGRLLLLKVLLQF